MNLIALMDFPSLPVLTLLTIGNPTGSKFEFYQIAHANASYRLYHGRFNNVYIHFGQICQPVYDLDKTTKACGLIEVKRDCFA